ncbi:hypothetical protein HOLleu_00995 [Holothuria leucospilota]|uniref:Ig-like domain-containing protein n=1 Tax=Holothuria leucospilota TaxID=206669 RepID=A0A9Q1HK08_HOLLE|nr:hypothetical protein HOLleu_00995 [Holothuria leucospilota]
MILLGYNYFKSEVDSHYQCRMSPPVNDPNEVTVESLRTGWTRNTVEENPHPPDAYYDTSVSHPPYRVDMINNGNNDAFGVFGCNVTKDGKMETIISITRMRSDADIVPSNGLFTQTVSTGDTNVPIRMMRTTEVPLESLRWRNNTFLWGDPHQGVDNFIIDEPVELYHAGIYECHIVGDRHSAKHGLNLLIVRG